MLHITAEGKIYHPKVKPALRPGLASGDMKVIHGIVVHQTDSPTTLSTMNTYMKREKEGGTVGAHFLIDPDGTIYQTMSLLKRTDHVGPFLIPRCLVKGECEPFKLTEKI
ncbi:MAG: N-acetylmuramoyl-L-alanine amidase, partial [Burkholderiales bacterium]|nr:N-acetylmuramoyl-L-alanine amidase [Burkholderiales bacterium]